MALLCGYYGGVDGNDEDNCKVVRVVLMMVIMKIIMLIIRLKMLRILLSPTLSLPLSLSFISYNFVIPITIRFS